MDSDQQARIQKWLKVARSGKIERAIGHLKCRQWTEDPAHSGVKQDVTEQFCFTGVLAELYRREHADVCAWAPNARWFQQIIEVDGKPRHTAPDWMMHDYEGIDHTGQPLSVRHAHDRHMPIPAREWAGLTEEQMLAAEHMNDSMDSWENICLYIEKEVLNAVPA